MAARPVDAPSAVLDVVLAHALSGSLLTERPVADTVAHEPAAPVLAPGARTGRTIGVGPLDTGAISAVLARLEPTDDTTSFADDSTLQMSALLAEPVPSTAGKRRAAKRSPLRPPLFRTVPSAPLLIGVTALVIAAGGAVATGDTDISAVRAVEQAGPASALSGTSGTGSVTADRGLPLSRSNARVAVPSAVADGAPVAPELAAQRSNGVAALAGRAERRSAVIAENRWQTPLDDYRLTARFGQYGLWASYHTGLDFAAPSGTPIHAIANGVVTSAGYDGSYGNKTVITLDDGTELWFCHQTAFAVSVGDTVRGGETIGYVGSTGNVTGPHVHIEVRPGGGDPIDPYPAFVEHGVTP